MTRRSVMTLLAAIVCCPRMALAQATRRPYRVGYLTVASPEAGLAVQLQHAFRKGMQELGYIEGRHYVLEVRSAGYDYERLPALAAELVQAKVDVIVSTGGTPALHAIRKTTPSLPVVVPSMTDPVALGFVASLARPGGNITGLTNMAFEIGAKQLELLGATSLRPSRVAVLANPDNPGTVTFARRLEPALVKLGAQALHVSARSADDIEKSFAAVMRERPDACILVPDPVINGHFRRISELAAKHRIGSIASYRQYPEAGGLMSYGRDLSDSFRRAASYVDKILKGARAGDLPIEQPTKFEMVVNLKTAKALEITIPEKILLSADEVIQ
ncbi:MAG: ABC transporter substrate-binding protein [Betaproteobacteria bacterium]